MNELKRYNEEMHEKAAFIAKKFMFDGMAITSKGRSMDVT